jgi:hypothetical protein
MQNSGLAGQPPDTLSTSIIQISQKGVSIHLR